MRIPPLSWSKHVPVRPLLAPAGTLAVLVATLAAIRPGVFTIDELNTDCSAAMSLVLVATGETFVILRGGIDLSVGGTISLATALATTLFRGNSTTAFWAGVIVVIGGVIGLINGFLITVLELQPFLVTLAMWSMVGGAAMMILPTEGGTLPEYWVSAGTKAFGGLSLAAWGLIVLLVWWAWFRRTRICIAIRSAGSNERSAFLSRVSLPRVNLASYGLSGVFASVGGLFLTT